MADSLPVHTAADIAAGRMAVVGMVAAHTAETVVGIVADYTAEVAVGIVAVEHMSLYTFVAPWVAVTL